MPENFAERVMDLENQMQLKPEDESQTIKKLGELMSLYAAAIEVYHSEPENQMYFNTKLMRLIE